MTKFYLSNVVQWGTMKQGETITLPRL